MAGQITVSTDQVAEIANSIESLNNRLKEKLEESNATIKNLARSWEGEASGAARRAGCDAGADARCLCGQRVRGRSLAPARAALCEVPAHQCGAGLL